MLNVFGNCLFTQMKPPTTPKEHPKPFNLFEAVEAAKISQVTAN